MEVRSMAHSTTAETMALHYTLKALSFAYGGNFNTVTGIKDSGIQARAYFHFQISITELHERSLRNEAILLNMAKLAFTQGFLPHFFNQV